MVGCWLERGIRSWCTMRYTLDLKKIRNYGELERVCTKEELGKVWKALLAEKMRENFNEEDIEFIGRVSNTLFFNDLLNEVSFQIYL